LVTLLNMFRRNRIEVNGIQYETIENDCRWEPAIPQAPAIYIYHQRTRNINVGTNINQRFGRQPVTAHINVGIMRNNIKENVKLTLW